MKQILQNLGNGDTLLADVPVPRRASGAVLSRTTRSLVSLGTEKMLIDFQHTCQKLKYSNFPVIGAPSGLSLGGGFEILLHCDTLVVHTNNVSGLVETKVGLIPSGGGCKEMLARWSGDTAGPVEAVKRVFRFIGPAKTATSPMEAEAYRFFLNHDLSIMNRDRILAAAKNRALVSQLTTTTRSKSTLPPRHPKKMQRRRTSSSRISWP